jgi:hypothetical protein
MSGGSDVGERLRGYSAVATLALIALVLLAGCVLVKTGAKTSQESHSSVRIAEGERVGILFSSDAAPEIPVSFGQKMVECVGDSARKMGRALSLLQQEEIYAELFPGLTPRQVMIRADTLPLLVARPEVQDRINRLRLRYLVLVGGDLGGEAAGVLIPSAPPGGLLWWQSRVRFTANVFELGRGTKAGSVRSEAR